MTEIPEPATTHDTEVDLAIADAHTSRRACGPSGEVRDEGVLLPARLTPRDLSMTITSLEEALLRLRHGTPR